MRISRFTPLALAAAALSLAHAGVVEPTPVLPPPGGLFPLPGACLTLKCLGNVTVSNFEILTDVAIGGNELVTTKATFAGNVFQNNGGGPGALLGPLAIVGTMNFLFFGRQPGTQTGTFNAQITDFDFFGPFQGQTLEVKQSPTLPSTGQITITSLGEHGPYSITSFFDVFAEISVDSGPFMPGPPRRVDLTDAVPEPGTAGLALVALLAGVKVFRR